MKAGVICPFSLERLTGTPIRAKTTTDAVLNFGYEVLVVARESKPIAGAKVITSGSVGLASFTRISLAALRAHRPDIVHGLTTASIVPMLLYKWLFSRRVKIIFEMHGWAWFEQERSSRFLVRFALSAMDYLGLWFADAVIAVSKTEKKFLARRTFGSGRINVIWDPVDFNDVYLPAQISSSVVVGYIGNSAWYQGLQHLIDAAKILASSEQVSFRLAGFDSSDQKMFPPLPHVSYIGRVERADVIPFLQGCDMLVSPRLPEKVSNLQFPHKLSEYLIVGRPVIVSAASDQPDVIREGKCGIVAEPLSGEGIAEAIRTVAKLSATERGVWGRRAYEYAHEHIHAKVFAKKLGAVYASVLR
ncbi:glycosyltransferase [Candidatus Kaiserbacteria bacterium]|nr:glycosyltransferase [Candidatus Kaiserbacteria bacterium]